MTLAGLGATALSEGIKFFYGQAGEFLSAWRIRHEGRDAPGASLAPPAGLLAGTPRGEPQLDTPTEVVNDMRSLRQLLSEYVDGIQQIDEEDQALLETVDAIRRTLEIAYAQRLTFAGELNREAGPIVVTKVEIEHVRGVVTGLRADHISEGRVQSIVNAGVLDQDGTITGAIIQEIGR